MTDSREYIFIDEVVCQNSIGEPEIVIPQILDMQELTESIPTHFNSVKITLAASTDGDLDWKQAHAIATQHVQEGRRLFWQLELGLFAHLKAPLSDQTQYLALGISLRHFRDTLWKEFRDQTLGVCLYNGNIDFSLEWKWDDEQILNLQTWLHHHPINEARICADQSFHMIPKQFLRLFCRDAALEYLNLLARQLPGELASYACLDTHAIHDPFELAQLLTKERFESVDRMISRSAISKNVYDHPKGWMSNHSHYIDTTQEIAYGVCLPSINNCTNAIMSSLKEMTAKLAQKNIPFRILPETSLTNEWHGLDYLLVATEGITPQGVRMLRGFCAAGGTVLSIGKLIGLPQEIPFLFFDFPFH